MPNYINETQELIKRLRNNKVTLGHGEYGVDPLCELAADEIDRLCKEVKEADDDWNMLRDKYDMLVIENMDLKKRIAHLEKVAADASWTAEMYRDQIDDQPKW